MHLRREQTVPLFFPLSSSFLREIFTNDLEEPSSQTEARTHKLMQRHLNTATTLFALHNQRRVPLAPLWQCVAMPREHQNINTGAQSSNQANVQSSPYYPRVCLSLSLSLPDDPKDVGDQLTKGRAELRKERQAH
mmetsp:Transcript_45786/g.90172  ORF Transcript_45786/g.90172 Transcript_45786/m.90172 type:complete len:135 (-) Transcript_45786:460-864(-)